MLAVKHAESIKEQGDIVIEGDLDATRLTRSRRELQPCLDDGFDPASTGGSVHPRVFWDDEYRFRLGGS